MTTTYYPRSIWTSVQRSTGLVHLNSSVVHGIAVHYTGSVRLGQAATLAQTISRLEGERRFHTNPPPAGRGWTDIAYQVAFDVEGRVFDCRGIGFRSAANGNALTNSTYGAAIFLLGVGDHPTTEMIEAFRDWRYRFWLKRYPNAGEVVGHRDLYNTSCPGDPTYELISRGTLAARPDSPVTAKEGDMPTVDQIVAGIMNYVPPGQAFNAATLLHRGYEQAALNTTILIAMRNGEDMDCLVSAIADAVVARLGDHDGGSLSRDSVKDALREVLTEGTGGTP